MQGDVVGQTYAEEEFTISNDSPRVATLEFNLPPVRAGEKCFAKVRILNGSDSVLQIRGVEKSCGCMNIDMPAIRTSKQNEAIELDVSIAQVGRIKSLKRSYTVFIRSSGPCDSIVLRLNIETTGFVGFDNALFNVLAPPAVSRWHAFVPLTVANDVDLSKYEIRFSQKVANIIDAKFAVMQEKDVVELKYDPQKCADLKVIEMSLVPKGGVAAGRGPDPSDDPGMCRLDFSIEKPIELLPRVLTFLPIADPISGREARAIVKVVNASKDLTHVSTVKCLTPKDKVLACEIQEVRSGYYVMKVKLERQDDLHEGDQLRFTFETTNDTTELSAISRISN